QQCSTERETSCLSPTVSTRSALHCTQDTRTSTGRVIMLSLCKSYCALIVGLLLVVSTPVASQTPQGGAIVFEGARLIAGDGGTPIEDSAFLIENGRFTQVGRKGQVTAPTGAMRIDLTGKTVIPGIVDAHGHPGFLDAVTGKMSKANFTREN